MLLRRFVGQRLASYYAQSADAVVSSSLSSEPVPFRRLLGDWHWKRLLNSMYQGQTGHWFTPVELFKPYYSNCIANFIASHASSSYDDTYADGVIDVVELGGGRATNAITVLDHLKAHHPETYDKIHYTLVDSSPTLHKYQRERVKATDHGHKVSFSHKDLSAVAERKTTLLKSTPANKERLTFVIALEVFDNLPHDKIKSLGGGGRQIHHLQQATVSEHQGQYEESFETVADPLLTRIMQLAPSYARNPVTWVPTVALGLLHDLPNTRPNTQLLVADFDWFPGASFFAAPNSSRPPRRSLLGQQEPLINPMTSDKPGDDQQEYECYLTAPPLSDILFPTHFPILANFLKKSWKDCDRDIQVQKQADFLIQYGPKEVEQTTSWLTGFSPMIHDYSNMSVLTATISNDSPLD